MKTDFGQPSAGSRLTARATHRNVALDGQITVLGRVAHMLKLRGHSIQTRELTQTMAGLLGFSQAIPWVQQAEGQGQALVFYYTADAAQKASNAARVAGWRNVPVITTSGLSASTSSTVPPVLR